MGTLEIALENALKSVNYQVIKISVTRAIRELLNFKNKYSDDFESIEGKINGGNSVREMYKKKGILSAHAMMLIQSEREKFNYKSGKEHQEDENLSEIKL